MVLTPLPLNNRYLLPSTAPEGFIALLAYFNLVSVPKSHTTLVIPKFLSPVFQFWPGKGD